VREHDQTKPQHNTPHKLATQKKENTSPTLHNTQHKLLQLYPLLLLLYTTQHTQHISEKMSATQTSMEVMLDRRGRAEQYQQQQRDSMDEESLVQSLNNKEQQQQQTVASTTSASPLVDTSANATSSSDEEEEDGVVQEQQSRSNQGSQEVDQTETTEEEEQEGEDEEPSSFMNADLQACREGTIAGMVQRVKPYHERYVGQIRRGRWEGRGRLVYSADDPRGRIDYDGEFRAGRRHGKGKLRWRNGCIYKGSWKDDMMQGTGSMKWPTGTTSPPLCNGNDVKAWWWWWPRG
jgi:hypothetical protein